MRRIWPVSFFALIGVFGCSIADKAYFRSDARQLAILKDYLPSIKCDDAEFTTVEIEDSLFDYGYVFQIEAGAACINSLKSEMHNGGYMPGERNSALADENWLVKPKLPGAEVVAFRFETKKNIVTWVRDKT